jgi:hypothetical protein
MGCGGVACVGEQSRARWTVMQASRIGRAALIRPRDDPPAGSRRESYGGGLAAAHVHSTHLNRPPTRVQAVRRGRGVYDNLKKVVLFALPTNMAQGEAAGVCEGGCEGGAVRAAHQHGPG